MEGVTCSQPIEHIFIEVVMCTLQRLSMKSCLKLYYGPKIELFITRKFFNKICLHLILLN